MDRTWLAITTLGLAAAAAGGCSEKSATAHGPLPTCATAASTVSLGVGAYAAYDITADSGCAVFPANASTTDSAEYLVVVQSAGGPPGDSSGYGVEADRVAAAAGAARGLHAALVLARRSHAAQASLDRALHERARRLSMAASRPAAPQSRSAAALAAVTPPTVGSLKAFSVCANMTCTAYSPITARALVVGVHVAVYEDTLAPANGLSATDIDSIAQVLDTRVYPLDTLAFGRESDVDSNGVVLVVLTNVVNKMVTASQCTSTGYVTGFFDATDLAPATAAQHNDGEVYFGLVPDPSGTLSCAHSVAEVVSETAPSFAHEFEYLINFVQHVLVRGVPAEDEWLDEALANYAIELVADSYLPADTTSWINGVFNNLYDAYQYLSAPDQHFLLATANTAPADDGAGWLYMRYLVDQMGFGLTRQLVLSGSSGTANVTQATGLPFGTTVERWALANWVSDLSGFSPPGELTYTSWSFRAIFGELASLDPTDFPLGFPLAPAVVTPGSLDASGSLRAGSGVYLLVHQNARGGPDTLHVNPGAAALPGGLVPQFAVIRLY
ncbi:MAG TPA: hypothetical protein VEH83_01620 [Gemmatimonadales bacterium]|nr:hypothetical protein [Gemmatimonadales bacterium]